MITGDAIKAALRKLNTYASGESPSAAELADGLVVLQMMLRSWAGRQLLVFASGKDSLVLTPGTGSYTWGSGGVLTTARPHKVTGAYLVDSGNISSPIEILTEGKYRGIADKTVSGMSSGMFWYPSYPLSVIYLNPVPDAVYTLWMDSIKPFTETSSFASLTDVIQVPTNYEEAIVYNLAVRFASDYGKAIPVEVAALSGNLLDHIMGVNSSNQVESVSISVPGGKSGGMRYSINSDSSR